MHLLRRLLVVSLVTMSLIGCGIGDSPEIAAREWLEAIGSQDGNTIVKRTCHAQREAIYNASMWSSAFSVFGQLLTNSSVKSEADISDLSFKIVSKSNLEAEVYVSGELRVAVLGAGQAEQLDHFWMMIYEDDTWRWCGDSANYRSGSIAGSDTQPQLKDLSGAIAFIATRPRGESRLYISSPDSADLSMLVNTKPGLKGIYWSSDSSQIAYFQSNRNGDTRFETAHILNLNAGIVTQIFETPPNNSDELFSLYDLSWSPDNKRIALTVRIQLSDGSVYESYIMNSSGSELISISERTQGLSHPLWSPNGQSIMFNSDIDGDPEIYITNINSMETMKMTDNSSEDFYRGWSPDGNNISYLNRENGRYDMYITNGDGTEPRKVIAQDLGEYIPWDESPHVAGPYWSNNGNYLAFTYFTSSNNNLKWIPMVADVRTGELSVMSHDDDETITINGWDGSDSYLLTDIRDRDTWGENISSAVLGEDKLTETSGLFGLSLDGNRKIIAEEMFSLHPFNCSLSPDDRFVVVRDDSRENYSIVNIDSSESFGFRPDLQEDETISWLCWSPTG